MHPEGPGVQGQTAGVAVKLTKAAKRRTAKRQTQDKSTQASLSLACWSIAVT